MFLFFIFLTCVYFHFFKKKKRDSLHSGRSKERHGRSRHDQSKFRVCRVNLATPKIAKTYFFQQCKKCNSSIKIAQLHAQIHAQIRSIAKIRLFTLQWQGHLPGRLILKCALQKMQ